MDTLRRLAAPFAGAVVVLALATIGADRVHLYYFLPHFDKVFHVAGGFVIAWMAARFLLDDRSKETGLLQRVLLLAGCACIVGILWEAAERLSSIYAVHDFRTLYHFFHGGDLDDTIGDLLADLAGGLLGGLLFALRSRGAHDRIESERAIDASLDQKPGK